MIPIGINYEIAKHIEMMEQNNLYSLVNSKYGMDVLNKCKGKNKKDFFELFKEWDLERPLDKEVGKWIEQMVDDPSLTFGFHRSSSIGEDIYNDIILDKILTEGLKILGDADSGAVYNYAPPTKSIQFPNDSLLTTLISLKSNYKASNVAILFCFPSEIIDKEGKIVPGRENEVCDFKEGITFIRPEYICGILIQHENGLEYVSADTLKEQMAINKL